MRRPSKPVGILIAVAAVAATGWLAWALSYARQGYEPRQPIQFRHSRMAGPAVWQVNAKGERTNVGGYDIPCLYCHTMPYKGRHSTVPSTAVCMNCHSTVGLGKEWVLKVKEYWDRGEPIPWVKVHDMPDFVYYDHSAHLTREGRPGQAEARLQGLPRRGREEGHRARRDALQHGLVRRLPPQAGDGGVRRLHRLPPLGRRR